MKQLTLILLFQFSMVSTFAQWTNLGLDEYQVNDLTVYSDTIYASTENGIYKKSILNLDSEWSSCGKQGHHVVQTLVENYQTFYSLLQIDATSKTQLYKSTNAGLSFSLLTTDTSNYNYYQYLDHIAHPANNYDTLYLLNHQLKTNDGGSTWESINSSISTDRFIMVNPTNLSQLIIGGEGDLFNAYLQVSNDFGDTWTYPSMNSFFAGDNAIHDIAIDEDIWYAAGEGIIAQSNDEGENWVQLLNLFDDNSPFSLYYTNIEFSPVSTDILYVSGLNQTNADEVPLLYSENQGATWDTISQSGISQTQRIRCLTVENIENSDHVFLGGKGVYLYRRMVSNVANKNINLNLTIYPNPVADIININYTSVASGQITTNVFDLQGRLITQQQEQLGIGEQTFTIDTSSLSQGTYVLQLIDGERTGSREFVVR